MIILYWQRYLKHLSCVTAKRMEAITLIRRLSAKSSIFVQMMGMVEEQSTVFCVQMVLSSSSNILCVIGGSMLTALVPSNSIPSMMKMLLKGLLTLQQELLVPEGTKEGQE